jgi:hypothetical protein
VRGKEGRPFASELPQPGDIQHRKRKPLDVDDIGIEGPNAMQKPAHARDVLNGLDTQPQWRPRLACKEPVRKWKQSLVPLKPVYRRCGPEAKCRRQKADLMASTR